MAGMRELSTYGILVANDSDEDKNKEKNNKEEEEYWEDMDVKEGKVHFAHCPNPHTTSTNINPFTLKCGKVLGGDKMKVEKKNTLQELLGKLQVFV